MSVEIRDSYLKVNGIRYFRGNASVISLGDFGRKKQPVFRTNYLEVYDNAGLVDVDLEAKLILDVDQEELRKAMGSVTVAFAEQNASANLEGTKEKKWNLSLIQLAMSLSDIESNVLDQEDEEDFKRLGTKARVAYQVWIVLEAEYAKKVKSAGNLKATVLPGGAVINGELGANGQRETLVKLSKGSTFAYLLAKRKENSHFTTDQHGPS